MVNTGGGTWYACSNRTNPPNSVTCDIRSWSDHMIDFRGFTGPYGYADTGSLAKGDNVTLEVWNSKTGAGPGTLTRHLT